MKQIFLFRLFRHSKLAFFLTVAFVILYVITFCKKMDMVFFPYNSMYTIDFSGTTGSTTYGMKINGTLVKITGQPYWKKDFLETSMNGFCRFVKNGNKVFMEDYINHKFSGGQTKRYLLNTLVPPRSATGEWPSWYGQFAGYEVPRNAVIEILEYQFALKDDKLTLKDSTVIYKSVQ